MRAAWRCVRAHLVPREKGRVDRHTAAGTHISALTGIFKGQRLLFSEKLSDEWVGLPNKGQIYGGRRSLNVMIEGGISSLLLVRRHVDALRGGVWRLE